MQHSILPYPYARGPLHQTVIEALSPYISGDAAAQAWDLEKAWNEARRLLAKKEWKYHNPGADFDVVEVEFTLRGNAAFEKAELNTIVAGIVAKQMMEPQSGVAVKRIERTRKGDMNVVLSPHSAHALRQLVPGMRVGQHDSRVSERHDNVITPRFR
jgi:hypothetical protein